MASATLSLGQAIDQIITALEGLEEGTRATAVETACAHLRISLASRPAESRQRPSENPPPGKESNSNRPTPQTPATSATDIRSLRAEKKPRSAREMACVVAFYLQELAPEGERKESISSADLEKYF